MHTSSLLTLSLTTLTLAAPLASTTAGGTRSYACNATVAGNGIYTFRNYTVACNQRVVSGTVQGSETLAAESDCLRSCNSVKYCVYASYELGSGACDMYYEMPQTVVDQGVEVDGLVLVQ